LLARRSGVPVFVGRDRVAAGQALLAAHPECDVIVSDDGLQHYRLQRTVEVVVFDGRGIGNGWLLPAGPLREPLQRLAGVVAVVWNGPPEAARCMRPGTCRSSTCAGRAALRRCQRQFGTLSVMRRLPARPQTVRAGRDRRSAALFPAAYGRWGSSSRSIPFRITIPTRAADLAFAGTACC
jgi:hypothetical protein